MRPVPFKWRCPRCRQVAEITHGEFIENSWPICPQKLEPNDARVLESLAVACPNPECRRLTLTLQMFAAYRAAPPSSAVSKSYSLKEFKLEPSVPEPLPARVPEPIRKDYEEAWLIKDLSPKAAATLARRAVQGMIRNFWDIKGRNLNEEIETLRSKEVDPGVLDAIDNARKIGNAAAHMEQDTSLIVEVDSGEADATIWLIRELADAWYVRQHEREKRMDELKKIAAEKTGARK
jgi:hypothetical protein